MTIRPGPVIFLIDDRQTAIGQNFQTKNKHKTLERENIRKTRLNPYRRLTDTANKLKINRGDKHST